MISLSLLNFSTKGKSNFSYHSHIHMTVSVFVSKLSGMPGAIHSQFYLAMRNAENIQTIEYSVHQTQFLTNFLAFNTQLRLYLNYISSCRLSWIVIGYITLLSTIRIQVFNHISLRTDSADGWVSDLFSYMLEADGTKQRLIYLAGQSDKYWKRSIIRMNPLRSFSFKWVEVSPLNQYGQIWPAHSRDFLLYDTESFSLLR